VCVCVCVCVESLEIKHMQLIIQICVKIVIYKVIHVTG